MSNANVITITGNVTTISTSGGGGGVSLTSGSVMLPTWSTSSYVYIDRDTAHSKLLVSTKTGKKLDVGESLEKINRILGILNPDPNLLDRYPALKSAYEEYERQLCNAFKDSNPQLQDALAEYKTMEDLLKNSE